MFKNQMNKTVGEQKSKQTASPSLPYGDAKGPPAALQLGTGIARALSGASWPDLCYLEAPKVAQKLFLPFCAFYFCASSTPASPHQNHNV